MPGMRITNVEVELELAGFLVRQADLHRIIRQHICGNDSDPCSPQAAVANSLIKECTTELAEHSYWSHNFRYDDLNERVADTEISVNRIDGNLCTIVIYDLHSGSHEPGTRIEQELSEYRLVPGAAVAKIRLENSFGEGLDQIATAVNAAVAETFGPVTTFNAQDLETIVGREGATSVGNIARRVGDKALMLAVCIDQECDEENTLVVMLGNRLADHPEVPETSHLRIPHANEITAMLPFAKAVGARFLQLMQ